MKFLADKPPKEDELKTHKPIAASLLKHLEAQHSGSVVIGLFGDWGTGKSSVIYWLKEFVQNSEKSIAYAELDAWKSGEAYFGVSFVRALAYAYLRGSNQEKVLKKIATKVIRERSYPYREGAVVIGASLIFLTIILVASAIYLHSIRPDIPWINLSSFIFTALVVLSVQLFLDKFAIQSKTTEEDVSFEQANHFQRVLIEDILNKIDSQICCVVVDNIDRLEPDEAFAVIRKLKTFIIDEEKLNKSRQAQFVIVVPVDDRLLVDHIGKIYKAQDTSAAREFLKKFFNITLRIPAPIRTDFYAFTKERVTEAYDTYTLPEGLDNIAFILNRAANRNPRDVKLIINEFVSLHFLLDVAEETSATLSLKRNPEWIAFFVGLRFIDGGQLSTIDLKQLQRDAQVSIDSQTPDQFGPKRSFLGATRSFWISVDPDAWHWLVYQKPPDLQVNFPAFNEIYQSFVDRNSEAAYNLVQPHKPEEVVEILKGLYVASPGDDNTKTNITWTSVACLSKGLDPNLLPQEVISSLEYLFSAPNNVAVYGLIDGNLGLVASRLSNKTIGYIFKLIVAIQEALSEEGDYTEAEDQWIDFLVNYQITLNKKQNQLPPTNETILITGIPKSSKLARLLIENPVLVSGKTAASLAARFARDESFVNEAEAIQLIDSFSEDDWPMFAAPFLAVFLDKLRTTPNDVGIVYFQIAFQLLQKNGIESIPDFAATQSAVLDLIANLVVSRKETSERLLAYLLISATSLLPLPELAQKAASIKNQYEPSIYAGFDLGRMEEALNKAPALFINLPVSHNVAIVGLSTFIFNKLLSLELEHRVGTIRTLVVNGSEEIKNWLTKKHPTTIRFDILGALLQIFEEKNYDQASYAMLVGLNFPRKDQKFVSAIQGHYSKVLENIDLKTSGGISKLSEIISRFRVVPSNEQKEQIEKVLHTLNLEGFQGEVKALREACSGRFAKF